ncbi:MAG: DUF1492 domain-containing protein [Bacteroidales bacterium]|nr:DUF1492 domain-containing protein [Bacteroidales bacterium]
MTAREYLRQIRALDTSIAQKINEYESLFRLREEAVSLQSPNYSDDKVQTSRSEDSGFAPIIDRMVSLQQDINSTVDEFVDKRDSIINEIQHLGNTDYSSLLYKRYVEYKRLEVIAVEMNYSYVHVRRLHARALQCFEQKYADELKDDTQ